MVNDRRSILFNIVKNLNQTTFKSCKAGVSAFGWFLVILPALGGSEQFRIILWFILFIWFIFSNHIRTFKCIYFQVIFLVIDSFKVLVLFPLHICNKNQEYASYVNTDKIKGNNPYQYSNSKIKLKEGSVSQVIKFAKEKFKIKTEFC